MPLDDLLKLFLLEMSQRKILPKLPEGTDVVSQVRLRKSGMQWYPLGLEEMWLNTIGWVDFGLEVIGLSMSGP